MMEKSQVKDRSTSRPVKSIALSKNDSHHRDVSSTVVPIQQAGEIPSETNALESGEQSPPEPSKQLGFFEEFFGASFSLTTFMAPYYCRCLLYGHLFAFSQG